jgi:hypothetical protein
MTIKEALQKSEQMNVANLFKVRPFDENNDKFIITCGNNLASTTVYNTREEAEEAIANKDWNLIATLICDIFNNMQKKK